MKVNRKAVFAITYIVVALAGYILFVKYSFSNYEEERAIMEAEFAARFPSLKGYEPDYFFLSSVWGRNVVWVGLALTFGGMVSAFALMTISDVLSERKKKNL